MTVLRVEAPLTIPVAAIAEPGARATITVRSPSGEFTFDATSIQIDIEQPVMAMTFGDIVRWVSYETGVSVTTILGRNCHHAALRTRTATVWGAFVLLAMSKAAIGRRCSQDHTTIMAALRRAERWRKDDPSFRRLTDRLYNALIDRVPQ